MSSEQPVTPKSNVNAFESLSSETALPPIPIQNHESSSPYKAPGTFPPTPQSSSKPHPAVNSDPDYLVEVILETTHDDHSKGAWCRISREVPEQSIYQALSITREKMSLESCVNPGRYFLGTLKGLTGFSFQTRQLKLSSSPPAPPTDTDRPTYPSSQQVVCPSSSSGKRTLSRLEPSQPQDMDPKFLVKGWKMLYQPGKLSTVLNVLQRCVSGCDVQATWERLKQDRPDEEESLILDDFLDLMALKASMGSFHS